MPPWVETKEVIVFPSSKNDKAQLLGNLLDLGVGGNVVVIRLGLDQIDD